MKQNELGFSILSIEDQENTFGGKNFFQGIWDGITAGYDAATKGMFDTSAAAVSKVSNLA